MKTLRLPERARFAGLLLGTLGCAFGALLATLGPASTAGCGTAAAGGGTGNQDPAGSPILLGASIILSGTNDGNKNAMQFGLEAAVAQVNALGGILGRTVQV